ncbi:hypothetical protein IW262DRAFT_820050 [Armillaria fumosa]|nr:hypothetical protein IW262DRAFT_820050 [Armillaria fumosa]
MYSNDRHSRPHVSIPPGSQQSMIPASPFSPYAFELTTPAAEQQQHMSNPWDNFDQLHVPGAFEPRPHSMLRSRSSSPGRASTVSEAWEPPIAFPEPQLYRSSSQRTTLSPGNASILSHRHSRSALAGDGPPLRREESRLSLASSYDQPDDSDHYETASAGSHGDTDSATQQLSNLSLDSEEGLRKFQAGELPEIDQEWYKLVPPEARDALGKKETQRQSVLFEVFKSERDYVSDLEAVQDVFITPLRNASQPIIAESILPRFIAEVFGNLNQILTHHQRLLAALFARQREQHPFVLSIADIILETALNPSFRSAYEIYIKHYPIAESRHRQELKRNPSYQAFVQSVSTDLRIRKRDLVTFLSRSVTRLPRLSLLLEQILKLTDKDSGHPDLESLPISLGIFSDFIKSTQPGIEAAESKVKFWSLCESLQFQKGETIDMDLYDDSRTLVYSGPVARRTRSSTSGSWTDLTVALLDNYFLLTREETRPNAVVKRYLISRPLPLSFLRLGSFSDPPEYRKEYDKDGSVLGLRYHNVPIYPFTIYHASSRANRRYTLYVLSDSIRKKWYNYLVDAIGVNKVRQDGNMYFDVQTLSDSFFRVVGPNYKRGGRLTGKITSAVPFVSGGRNFLAVGCTSGIYVSLRGKDEFRKVLDHPNPTSIAAVQTIEKKTFNRLLVHHDSVLTSYSLDLVARVALGQAQQKTLEASLEKIAGHDTNVLFFRQVLIGSRVLIIYASKKLLQVSLSLQVLEAVDVSETPMSPRRSSSTTGRSFRPFGDAGYVPKDAYEITPLVKTIGICTEDGIVILDPTNLARSTVTVVPNLSDTANSPAMATLKSRLEDAKPLGLVRCDSSELLVVYDTVGCYITKHGQPSRNCKYVKWETQASSFAHRGAHFLLFSPEFIEIRNIATGRLVQVIEGGGIRFLYSGPAVSSNDTILVGMQGGKNDKDGVSDRIAELVETKELGASNPPVTNGAPAMWAEWDMQ